MKLQWRRIIVEGELADTVPLWMRTMLVADDETIYIPAAVVSTNEIAVSLCVMDDGISPVSHAKHSYVPIGWVEKNYPKLRKLCEQMREGAGKATFD